MTIVASGLLDFGNIASGSYTSFAAGTPPGYWPQPIAFNEYGNAEQCLFINKTTDDWGPFNALGLLNADTTVNSFWPLPFAISLLSMQQFLLTKNTIVLMLNAPGTGNPGLVGTVRINITRPPGLANVIGVDRADAG